jgi:hypothetical protein
MSGASTAPVMSLLDTSLPGVVTLVPLVLDSHLVARRSGHYDHLVSCILGQGILFFQLCFKQLLPFGPLHPVGCQVKCGALNLLFIVVAVG